MTVVAEQSIEIARGAEEVFWYLLDPRHFREWDRSVVSASRPDAGPLRVGSKTTVVHRAGPWKMATTEELVEFDPPRQFANRGVSGPLAGVSRCTVEPLDGGARTRLTTALDIEARGIGRLLVPLARWYGRRAVPRLLKTLRDVLDRGAVTADGAPEPGPHG